MTSNTPNNQTVDDLADEAAHTADKVKAKVKTEAAGLADHARDLADGKFEEGKAEATSRIDRTAEQIRNAGQEFGDDSYQAQAAEYLASNLSQAAEMIRGKDLGDLVGDVTLFARRNPALFLGGAALLGFAAARMMKASDTGHERANFERAPYDRTSFEREPYA